MSVNVVSLKTAFLFSLVVFSKGSVVNSFATQHLIRLNSTAYYDNQTARFSCELNFHMLPSTTPAIILRVILELLDYEQKVGSTSSLFTVSSTERFQYIETPNSDIFAKENVTVYFDHVYTGHYKLKVERCRNRYSCSQKIHESDLGFVQTNLNNIDVAKMNISISTTPTDIGGIDVAFTVQYFNDSRMFLPFEEFIVTLIPSDGSQQAYYRKVIGETKAEFHPCFALASSNTTEIDRDMVGCANLTNGQYTTRIDPIDTRCNFPEQIVASIKRPCRRYIISNVSVIPVRLRRDENTLESDVVNLTYKFRPFGTPLDTALAYGARDSRFDPWQDRFSNQFLIIIIQIFNAWSCGPMDKALAYGARDSRFDPWQDRT
ncbi:hypothetical protein GHT06_018896 [Daphnia sinensis]|uniref:CUB domain-containing protein n=1 Tax=Daphnia sinensis TaxID=1820382 RepID=A0AAD5PR76_9CRUS|nr:hypothetical protein GHT06_018896 [Daphnia sinensis]